MIRFLGYFMGIWLIYARIVDEFYRFIEKILSSHVKTKQRASRKRLHMVHQFIAFFTEPHSFGLCKAWGEGVTDTMNFGTAPGCVPAIS